MGDSLPTDELDPYREYRKYLFKYHEALERLKDFESVKAENAKLRDEKAKLLARLDEIEKDRRAAHAAAEAESQMLRAEIRRLKKSAKKPKKLPPRDDSSVMPSITPAAPVMPLSISQSPTSRTAPDPPEIKLRFINLALI